MYEEIVSRDNGRRVEFNTYRISEAITAAFDTVGYTADRLLDVLGGALTEYTHRLSEYWVTGTRRLFRFMFSVAHELAHLLLHCLCAVAAGMRIVETYDRDTVKYQDAAIAARMEALAATFLGSIQLIRKRAMIRRQERGSITSVSEDDNNSDKNCSHGCQHWTIKKRNYIIIRGGPPHEHNGEVYRGFHV